MNPIKFNFKLKFSSSTDEVDIANYIEEKKEKKQFDPYIISLLDQSNEVYKNRGTNQVNRIRGYILASFEVTGFTEEVLVYIYEELENSIDPYMIAASAMAIRGSKNKDQNASLYLCKAIRNIGNKDNAVTFDEYRTNWKIANFTTATKEILLTLEWLGNSAENALPFLKRFINDEITFVNENNKKLALKSINAITTDSTILNSNCCKLDFNKKINSSKIELNILNKIELENQDGMISTYKELFYKKLTIVAFFYTRCDNPNKCSLTITKLSQLQKILKSKDLDSSIRIAAITYDNKYDTPERIKLYLKNRDFEMNNFSSGFRINDNDQKLFHNHFNLGVNYTGSIVNQHRIELFIVNEEGKIIKEFSHLQWNINSVYEYCSNYLQRKNNFVKMIKKYCFLISNTIATLLIAFFPKCPLCWMAYLNVLGISGLSWLKFNPKFQIILLIIMVVNLICIFKKSNRENNYIPFILIVLGMIFLLLNFTVVTNNSIKLTGIILIILSSLTHVFSFSKLLNLRKTI